MTGTLFANRAGTTLQAAIASSDVSLTVSSGTGALFPQPASSGLSFPVTLISATNTNTREIVYCTARSGDVMTIVRAREGTTALGWDAGSLVQNLATAQTLMTLATFAVQDTGSVNTINVTLPFTVASLADLNGTAFYVTKAGSPNTTNVTINVNGLGATTTLRPDGLQIPDGYWPAGAPGLVLCNGTLFYLLNVTAPGLLAPLNSPFFVGNPQTGSTPAVGTSNDSIPNTAWVLPDSGSNSNGYWRSYPDGTMEQWGYYSSLIPHSSTVTITLPKPFGNSIQWASACPFVIGSESGQSASASFDTGDLAHITVSNTGSDPVRTFGVTWEARGRWAP